MYSSISLHNEHQGFVGDATEAYWNNGFSVKITLTFKGLRRKWEFRII